MGKCRPVCLLMYGYSPWSTEIACHLQRAGVPVYSILAHTDPTRESELNHAISQLEAAQVEHCTIPFSGESPPGLVRSASRIRQAMRTRKGTPLITLYGGALAGSAYLSGVRPLGLYFMGSDILRAGRGALAIQRFAAKRATLLLANGPELASKANIALGTGQRVRSLCHGIDTETFNYGAKNDRVIRATCTRTFAPVYRNDLIVRALAQLKEDERPSRFFFSAGGPLLGENVELSRQLSSGSRAPSFLGGIAHNRMARYLAKMNVFVSMSASDGTPTSLLEAMACGLFPVVADISPLRFWVRQQEGQGILVSQPTAEGLAEALRQVSKDPSMLTEARTANRELVCKYGNIHESMRILREDIEAM